MYSYLWIFVLDPRVRPAEVLCPEHDLGALGELVLEGVDDVVRAAEGNDVVGVGEEDEAVARGGDQVLELLLQEVDLVEKKNM